MEARLYRLLVMSLFDSGISLGALLAVDHQFFPWVKCRLACLPFDETAESILEIEFALLMLFLRYRYIKQEKGGTTHAFLHVENNNN